MDTFTELRPIVRAYVLAVVAVGLVVLGLSVHKLIVEPIGSEWLILAGLTVLTGSFSVKVPSINAYISVSEAFVFASVLLFGPEAGTITVLLECLVILLWMKPQGRPLYRMTFNLAAPSIAIWFAGKCFYLISDIRPYSEVFTPLPSLFVPLLAFTALYFVFNSSLVAVAVGLETERSPRHIWWKNFAWLSVNYFSGASLAALIVTYTQRLEFSTLAVIVPLLVVSYLTFRTAMGRAEDSFNHLSQLNRLYLSTIETLAMAIDAKDQITHGHIRRVQIFAVGLAKKLGVTDDNLLKAIEAAALLHDMGKLAVPEHILNKPGKLTPAEFEKMKLHAGVGADILSAIDFPYPVVPIVRHHHENWDGSGYPDGIKGTDIPIGARILSVVDCFDALTSDRPYRPRLSDDEALGILRERRGSMYDPFVVDTFIRVHADIAPDPMGAFSTSPGALAEIASKATSGREPIPQPESSSPTTPLSPGLLAALADREQNLYDALAHEIRSIVRFDLAILFSYDRDHDHLEIHTVAGASEDEIGELHIAVGERLSGWVAANKRPIVNSDPALDLGQLAKQLNGGLTHALSVPVCKGREMVGVMATYRNGAYTDHERSLAEQVAKYLPERLAEAPQRKASSGPSVPSASQARALAVSAVICVVFTNWRGLQQTCGESVSEERIADLTTRLRHSLSGSDLIVRNRDDEVAILLSRVESRSVKSIARLARQTVSEMNGALPPTHQLEVAVEAMLAPVDSAVIWELLYSEAGAAKENGAPQAADRVH